MFIPTREFYRHRDQAVFTDFFDEKICRNTATTLRKEHLDVLVSARMFKRKNDLYDVRVIAKEPDSRRWQARTLRIPNLEISLTFRA